MARNDVSKTQRMLTMSKAIACMDTERGYRETKRNLEKAEFRYLGGGAFGSAWTHDDIKGWCIKLASGTDNYPAFVYWAMANPNRHVPEFQYPTFDGERHQFMVMLQLLSDGNDYDDYYRARDICQQVAFNGGYEHCETELQQVCYNMGHFFGNKVSYDMHTGNALFDPELGCLVLTDPICGGESESFIAKVTGRPFKEQIQVQCDFNFVGGRTLDQIKREREQEQRINQALPDAVKFRGNEFFNVPHLDPMVLKDFGHLEARMAGGFGNPQQIPRADFRGRILPPGAKIQRIRDDLRMMYIEEVHSAGGRLLALDRVPFEHGMHMQNDNQIQRAAQWVKDNGLKPHRAEQLAREAQQWPDERLRGMDVVVFANMPSRDLAKLDTNPDACALAPIQHWHVPVDVLRVLRDQYKIRGENAGRLGWGGRFANAVKREVGRFI